MMDVVDFIAGLLLVFGSFLVFLAGVGIIRFPDIYARMHAAAKAPTLGILAIAVGVSMSVRTAAATFILLLVVILQLLSAPMGTHLLARAVYRKVERTTDSVDELFLHEQLLPDPDSQTD
jgi:multicomponent Na+:H+ antiporter subunit G